MLKGAMNFPVRPVLKELEAFSKQGFDRHAPRKPRPLGRGRGELYKIN
jgi:hypothetical protein